MNRTRLAFTLAATLGAAAPQLAHAGDPGQACLYKFYNVTNNLRGDLSQATRFLEQGEACLQSPAVRASAQLGAIEREAQKARTQLADARKALTSKAEAEAYYAEVEALTERVNKDDGFGFEKLRDEQKALLAKGQALAKTNERISPNASAFRHQKRAFEALAVRRARGENDKHVSSVGAAAVVAWGGGKFKPEDALDQKKVREAFLAADAKHFAVAVEGGGATYDPAASNFDYGRKAADSTEEQPVRGAHVWPADRGGLEPLYRSFSTRLKGNVPGLVWNVAGPREVIFVTMDGGRYRADPMKLSLAWIKPELWPTEQQHEQLLPEDLKKLVATGGLDASVLETLAKPSKAYQKCADKIWKANDAKFDAIRAQDIRQSTKKVRLDQLGTKVRAKVRRTCGKYIATYRKAWVGALDAVNKERAETAKVVRARMLELVATLQKKSS